MRPSYTHRRAAVTALSALLATTSAAAQSSLDQPPVAQPQPVGASLPVATAGTDASGASGASNASSASNASNTGPIVRVAAGRGLTVATADERVSITVRGFVQPRVTIDIPADPMGTGVTPTVLFSVRRARVILSGNLYGPRLSYNVHFGLAPQDFAQGAPLFDAFVTWAPHRDLSLRAGQMFVPFNRNRWISIMRQLMIERPLATNEFNLDRDLGVQLFSNDLFGLGQRLTYNLGVFNGAGRNRLDADYGLLYIARIGVQPLGRFEDNDNEWDLARGGPRLAIGVAGAYNQRALTYATAGLGAMPDLHRYDRVHLTGDLLFKAFGFSLQIEGLARLSNGATPDTTALAQASRPGWGYTAQAGYVTPVRVGVGARFSQIFALPDAMGASGFRDGYEVAGVLAYHGLDGALTVSADYTLRDESTAYPRHEIRVQAMTIF